MPLWSFNNLLCVEDSLRDFLRNSKETSTLIKVGHMTLQGSMESPCDVQSNKSTCIHTCMQFMLVLPKEAATTPRNVASIKPSRDPFAYAHTSTYMADKSCICTHVYLCFVSQ